MKIINKKSLLLSLVFGSSLLASSYEYPQLYKDTKIMGMGGANIAVGGQATSIFYNSAGIADIPKEYGWEVDILNANIAVSTNTIAFMDDLDEANNAKTDIEKTARTLIVVEKYLGKNLNISANIAALSVAKKFKKYAFSIVPIGGLITNTKTHRGSGIAGIVETQGLAYSGVATAVSRDLEDRKIFGKNIQNISVGVGLKYIQYDSIYANLTIADLIADDFDLLDDKYSKAGTSTVLDLGLKGDIAKNLTTGLAIQNIGSIASENKENKIPATVGVGIAYKLRYDRVFFNQSQIAFDYIDLFRAYSQDKDFTKRTRLGLSQNIFDGWGGTLALQTGLYQGHPSYGLDFRVALLKVAFTSYTEELGAYSGQDPDKRMMLQLSLGW